MPPRLVAVGLAAWMLAAGWGPAVPPAQAQDATPAAACAAPTRADLERVPLAWQEALDGGDLAPLTAILDPAVVHHGATFDDVTDAAGATQALQGLLDGFPDLTWTLGAVVVDAPYVAATWTASGMQQAAFQGIEPTGRAAEWAGINVWRVACGRVVETWSELDQVGRLQDLGLRPTEATPTAGAGGEPMAASPATCADDGPLPRELVTRWWTEGWTAGDAAVFDQILAEDVMHHWATGPDTVGPAAVATRIAGWRERMPDLAIRFGDVIVDGRYAAGVWTVTGTPAGADPDAEPIVANGINVFRIECGRIAEVWSEMDALGLQRQLQEATATPAP